MRCQRRRATIPPCFQTDPGVKGTHGAWKVRTTAEKLSGPSALSLSSLWPTLGEQSALSETSNTHSLLTSTDQRAPSRTSGPNWSQQDVWTDLVPPGRLDRPGLTRTSGPTWSHQDVWTDLVSPGRLDRPGPTRTSGPNWSHQDVWTDLVPPGRLDRTGPTRTSGPNWSQHRLNQTSKCGYL
ncbi:unnamed protein product [Pleuronectes platessa]|uniref:Uncharacterized protein n=1 Tax=Pleuronectes platessa TaxID=8262 RepID=A0A9N7Y203_PLEPL|nr:unnamed protein product [Pleuronectes platessa]